MFAVKKLMPESLLNYRFRGTTMSYSELFVALENIIVDKVATVRAVRVKKNDTSAPMEIGMAAREDSEGASQEGKDPGRKAVVRKEAKDKRKAKRERY